MGSGSIDREDFRRRVDDAVLVLFALVADGLGWATTALLDQDVERARRVIDDDHGIDMRCEELTAMVKDRLAGGVTLDPDELENLIAVLQIVPELERSADLAEHIAQRALRGVGGIVSPRGRGLIQSMGDVGVRMWRVAAMAYRQRSRDASFQLSEADDELDALATSLVNEGVSDGADPQLAADLALVARFYERLGDHAVNLARRVDAMAAPRRLSPAKVILSPRRLLRSPGEKSGRLQRVLHALTRFRLVPTDDGFFELFEAAAANARDCADQLRKLTASLSDVDEHYDEIKGFERRGDEITRDLLRRLDASFITPYDREDIHALAEELDDVVDDMFSAASLIHLVQLGESLPELPELGDVLVAMADEMVALIGGLRTGEAARARLERIEHLERQGDFVFRRGMGRLFSGDYDALQVIKLKDI
ncbi:MAG: phosphate transport system protein, partial [Actinomycetota bacterium]|nr:phosphate transport system protein [Actinomycetota bacterium]